MRLILHMITGILTVAFLHTANAEEKVLKIVYFGHSCFLITSPQNVKILMDPYDDKMGYEMPDVSPDIITISHEHKDHNNAAMAKSKPVILRGLKDNGKDWERIKYKMKDVEILSIPSYHDANKGAERGKNSIFQIQVGGINLVHLGDLGHLLETFHLRLLGRIDILLAPVGGYYTIGPKEVDQLLSSFRPKITIPMHYKTLRTQNLPISRVDDFLKGKNNVVQLNENYYEVRLNKFSIFENIVVLAYQ